MTTYTNKAVQTFLQKLPEDAEVTLFDGGLLDAYLVVFPDGYKYKYVMIGVVALNEWSSAYTVKRSNSDKIAEKFVRLYDDNEDEELDMAS